MTKSSHNQLSGWITLIFFTTLFVMSGVIISFLIRDAKQFDAYHQQISYQTIYSVSWELTKLFEEQQRLAELVAKTYQQPITEWINDIDNPEKHKRVKEIIEIFFPQHYSFTLADHEGHALWDDLGENIGEKCLTELYEYSQHHNDHKDNDDHRRYAISSIHPGPSQYHYDLFLPVQGLNEAKILLISFSQTALIEKLANRQSVDHHLMMVDEQRANLIELTGSGGRDTIKRSFNLEHKEEALIYEGIGGKRNIDQTHWAVVDMIDPSLRQEKQDKLLFGISLTVISTLLLAFIGDFALSRYRHATEEREKYLQETNAGLEEEVAKRTELLTTQKAQLKLAATVFEQSTEGIIITDEHKNILRVNQTFLNITGY
jgi:PAS domain-containing protein